MKRHWHAGLILIPCTLALLSAGCAGGKKLPPGVKDVKGAKVQGQVVSNGQPVKLQRNETLQIHFFEHGKPPTDRVQSMGELTDPNGTFTIPGPTNNGIPPGKYRVAVISEIYGGDGTNRFEDTFGTENTPLVVDVDPEEGQVFVIDLGRKTVKRR